MLTKSYRNLILLPTLKERYEYLKLTGTIGESTFGFDRYLNQRFYQSVEWRRFRSRVIARDEGNDMGLDGYPIQGKVIIHHINPLSVKDFEEQSELLFDMENVICVSPMTHEAIHYGDSTLLPRDPIERRPNDTIPWR